MAQQHRTRGLVRGVIASGAVAVAATTVGVLALTGVIGSGAGAVEHRGTAYQYIAPWADGDRISPVSTEDAQIRSVVRAQQFEQAWEALAPRDEYGRTGQLEPKLNFDPRAEVGEAPKPTKSLVAGLTVYRHDGSDIDVLMEEYRDPSAATSAITEFRVHLDGEPLELSAIDGADDAQLSRSDCTDGGEAATQLSFSAVVEGIIRVTMTDRCTTGSDLEARAERMTELAVSAVGVAEQVYATPVPRAWMEHAANLPIIADGSWRAEELQIAGREDGLELDSTLPKPFAGAGVELMIRAQNQIFQFGDEEQATAVMAELLQKPDRSDRGPWSDVEERTGDADEVCGDGIHWQQGTTCWIRTGKYIVVANGAGHQDGTSEPIDRTQAELLEGH